MSNIFLGLNIDHVATLRNARGTIYPDPVHAAIIAEQSGVDGITVHLREDRRHITDRDVYLLREIIQTTMNLEVSITEEMIAIACSLKPNSCCLVPERRQELTTEGGLDVISNFKKLKDIISKFVNIGIKVSLFIDPDNQQISAARDVGASCVELHTGAYANACNKETQLLEYKRLQNSISCAVAHDLQVNAGHGLNYSNVRSIVMLKFIKELHIGHAIISRSIFCGLPQAIQNMQELLLRESRSLLL